MIASHPLQSRARILRELSGLSDHVDKIESLLVCSLVLQGLGAFLMTLLAALLSFFFFNDTATTEIYTLSLHDALPIREAMQRLIQEGLLRAERNRGVFVVE